MYTLSDYILDVLRKVNITQFFGVPGDYNLPFLDKINHGRNSEWFGNTNELNAAYMADGYARAHGIDAFVTTFGVGELSALNGLSGSVAEHVPVLEIVGSPSTKAQNDHGIVHHTFGDGNFDRFEKIYRDLGIKVESINKENAIKQINEIVGYIYENKLPAVIKLPVDLINLPINPVFRSSIPDFRISSSQSGETNRFFPRVEEQIKQACRPVIIVGKEVARFNLAPELQSFISKNNILFADLVESKGIVDESLEQFIGTYNGSISNEETKQIVDNADLVLIVGTVLNDSTSGVFTQSFDDTKTISINYDEINFYGDHQPNENSNVFKAEITELAQTELNSKSKNNVTLPKLERPKTSDKPLTQNFYTVALSAFLNTDDNLIVEQGTSLFSIQSIRLKANTTFVSQPLWSSIGFSFPAALGTAVDNPQKRTILCIGEGSLLLTVQAFAFAARNRLHPIIFVLDNNGYGMERSIHGLHESYNDVPKMNLAQMPKAFGAGDDYQFYDVKTEKELVDVMNKIKEPSQLTVVNLEMGSLDIPDDLKKFVKQL